MSSSLLFKQSLWGFAALGLDTDALLRRVGLGMADVERLPERIPDSTGLRLWTEAEAQSGRRDLGLSMARFVRVEEYDATGYLIRHSPTLGAALERFSRYGRLVAEGLGFQIEPFGELLTLRRPRVEGRDGHPQIRELVSATCVLLARDLTACDLSPREVHFSHRAPDDTGLAREIFCAPLHYDSSFDGFVIEASLLETPIEGFDPRLSAILERQAEHLLAEQPERGDFLRDVRSVLAREIRGGNPNAEHVASELGLSQRTLSRRLRALGTSHQQELDQLRCELATRYLRHTDMEVAELSFVLGFSDASAFNRAFKRWMRVSPSEFRKSGS
ncbi:MAG: AraC family transcriptional regulator [Myxococcales bacterium]|nr:AraC family transcriptional regulator [Myxococcales bacterium]